MKTDDMMNRKLANTAIATGFMVPRDLLETYGDKGIQRIKDWLESQAEEARKRAKTYEAEVQKVAKGH